MNDSKEGSRSSPALALLHHPVQGVEHLPDPLELLGVGVGHGLGHLVEPALGDLLAQLLEQLLEVLAGLGGDEVVVLEAPHPAGQVGGQQVELDAALGHHVVGDLLAAVVAGLAGVVGQGLEPGALLGHDLVELLGDLLEGPARGRRCSSSSWRRWRRRSISSRRPWTRSPSGRRKPEVEQAAQRGVGVAVVEQVVGQLGEQGVDLVLEAASGCRPSAGSPSGGSRGARRRRGGRHPRPR